ncbi:type II toxin-antitoxin system ParD family antitoxin [Porphyrobacter sp. AAP82]|uniref:type II toxin-antitoxin system ParD family antitoxin n=1 Tax=Porphyrobacter sp. AAP82 TaxID=1248917 RepID=UPI0003118013|nr:type II toxin-antitoxin system ParD family antitoxin [Porphyrobacter sp. AAP82]
MSKVEKISVSLTGELLAEVQQAVASGDFASTSEVVRAALREWREQRARQHITPAHLRRLLAEAEASGYTEGALDFAAIKAEGRRRLTSTAE